MLGGEETKTGSISDAGSDDNASSIVSERSQKTSKRRKKVKSGQGRPAKSLFRFNCFVAATDTPKQIFAVQFCHFIAGRNIFATASGARISIFECVDDNEKDEENPNDERDESGEFCGIKLLRAYDDPDRDEVFYTLAWGHEAGCPVLAFGGVRSVVRAIYLNARTLREKKFIGHTNAINDMKFHPTQPQLLLTASKDHSLRLWNVKTEICVAILGGVAGHRDEVLALDFDTASGGRYCVSGGMDHNLKIWRLDTAEMEAAIASSETFAETRRARAFPTLHVHFADFTTRSVHRNYVDSVRCFGDTFLSKSCENCVTWWQVGKLGAPLDLAASNAATTATTTIIHSFEVDDCELWFVRMELDLAQRLLCVGNSAGRIFVFDLDAPAPPERPTVLSHHKCTKPIRQIALSRHADILVCVCDDGKIWRWDRKH